MYQIGAFWYTASMEVRKDGPDFHRRLLPVVKAKLAAVRQDTWTSCHC
jgi:hypothetical protein